MPEKWESIKVREGTFKKIVKLKSMAEGSTLEPFTMGDIVEEAVQMALAHVEEGLATWGKKQGLAP
jgi:hypothetical protein